ncbi:MAG: FAD binding domain-containing protein [Planctomycetes bacterium]|nr:FAD binding domain-containing protein [Planctomycetota bacterium]
MQVRSPTTLSEALALLAGAEQTLTPVAGCTDIFVSWHHRPKDDLHLLDLSRLHELASVRLTADHLELGALTTYWQVVESDELATAFPLLVQAARQVGAIQIQTRGTWAGNIANASPAADGVAVMMAYDAVVLLRNSRGTTEVPLDQYYHGYKQTARRPDQLITALRLPRRRRDVEWFHKVGARSAQAISKVGVAVVHDPSGWRVVANSVAPYVCRCRALEEALANGRTFQNPAELLQVLRADIATIDDIRSTARYRETVLSRLLYYFLLAEGLPKKSA